MWFESIRVQNLRCLEQLEYRPRSTLNLVCGTNGSGKTSLLESFAVASLGKSFLTSRTSDIVRSGTAGVSVQATVVSPQALRSFVAVQKAKGQTKIELDGQPIVVASSLAQHVPILVINSKSPDLLTASPSSRRALIDRTVFHVKPDYGTLWKHYRHALRQRSRLLRDGGSPTEAEYWNSRLAHYAMLIDTERRQVVDPINQALEHCRLSEPLGSLALDYQPGWRRQQALLTQLTERWARDAQAGYTTIGVHRADLSLTAAGQPIATRLSRGQGKVIACTIITALADFIEDRRGGPPVMLVDDLAAELDDGMRSEIVDMINGRAGQRIYTAIKPADLPEIADVTPEVFHVEHHRAAAVT